MTTEIPMVDMSSYGLDVVSEDEVDSQTIRSLAKSLCGAFSDVGFCYITNHGFKQSLIDRMLEVTRTFFEMPVEYKNAYVRPHNGVLHGWIPRETESLNPVNGCDYKEAYNYMPVDGTEILPDVKDFDVTMDKFRASCHALTHRIFDLMSVGMDVEDRNFLRKCHGLFGEKGNTSTLRSIYYPPLPPDKDMKPNQVRCGEHSDYGSITLLFQDDAGGLEVCNLHGEYVQASPIPGTILINIGEMMQRWTSDKLIAAKHRVLMPNEEMKKSRSRLSVAFFVNPDDDVMITSLDNSNKYEPISSLQYLQERLAPTY